MIDPVVAGVTYHVASVEADLSLSDPSDSSISCRQTGEIAPAMIAKLTSQNQTKWRLKNPKVYF
ncbi:hypothetical protein N483_00530 [Pseudoalteromonas luteoviolacea NCIMB 1944]|nr:hypothetical protein N483_00530 [Pseudoalteromonas luteoviolacea NCIMB 1944]